MAKTGLLWRWRVQAPWEEKEDNQIVTDIEKRTIPGDSTNVKDSNKKRNNMAALNLESFRSNFWRKTNFLSLAGNRSNYTRNQVILFLAFILWMSHTFIFYQSERQFSVKVVGDLVSPGFSKSFERLKLLAEDKEIQREVKAQNVGKQSTKNVEIVENIVNSIRDNVIDSMKGSVSHSNPTSRKLKSEGFDTFTDALEVQKRRSRKDDEGGQSEEFIYVYEISQVYNLDLVEAPILWWSKQYEGEYELYDMIVQKNQSRTMDPEKATLFYIPFFPTRFMLLNISHAHPEDFTRTVQETSKIWENLLKEIQGKYPYFSRSNGRDHFSALTIDHGRCQALLYCDPVLYGEMFFLQLNGDKMVRSIHAVTTRGLQALSYNYGVPVNSNFPDIPCYMPDRDIVMPPVPSRDEIFRPRESERPIVALFCFRKEHDHGVPIPYFNHFVRKELLEMYENKNIDRWSFGESDEWHTGDELAQSIFCICPHGHSQWTSRPVKSIVRGSIPITFYRDHDQPWQDELEHSRFSLNIDADRLDTLKSEIEHVLKTPGKLQQLQKELEAVQEAFTWGPEPTNGARAYLMRALKRRAVALQKTKLTRTL